MVVLRLDTWEDGNQFLVLTAGNTLKVQSRKKFVNRVKECQRGIRIRAS